MNDLRWVRVWTRLKRLDPILVSARQSLEIDLGWKDRLRGMELWTMWEMGYAGKALDGRALIEETTALANPNRELAWVVDGADTGVTGGPPGSRDGDWWWCVVWEPDSPAPHHALQVCQRLLSRRTMECRELVRAVVWGLRWDEDEGDGSRATAQVAETRSRSQGLLVNPHVQSYELFEGEVPFPWWRSRRPASAGDRV